MFFLSYNVSFSSLNQFLFPLLHYNFKTSSFLLYCFFQIDQYSNIHDLILQCCFVSRNNFKINYCYKVNIIPVCEVYVPFLVSKQYINSVFKLFQYNCLADLMPERAMPTTIQWIWISSASVSECILTSQVYAWPSHITLKCK